MAPSAVSPAANVPSLSLEARLKIVVQRAAGLLPAEVGKQLLALIEPAGLATMAGVVAIWAAAQFFGVGEVADVVLIIVGYAAMGGVALQAGKELVDFSIKTGGALNDSDLNEAAAHLAKAVSLIGVQTVLALLLKKPGKTFKDQYLATPEEPNPVSYNDFQGLPRNQRFGYKPSTIADPLLAEGKGHTDMISGDSRYSMLGSEEEQALAKAHEALHQFLTPKANILRGLRGFVRAQGYNRSYILRFMEEMLAEMYAQIKVKGLTKGNVAEAWWFPVESGYVSVVKIQAEAKGLLLGPINVGGQIYNVIYSLQAPKQSQQPGSNKPTRK